jgi:hypothetical protein
MFDACPDFCYGLALLDDADDSDYLRTYGGRFPLFEFLSYDLDVLLQIQIA